MTFYTKHHRHFTGFEDPDSRISVDFGVFCDGDTIVITLSFSEKKEKKCNDVRSLIRSPD